MEAKIVCYFGDMQGQPITRVFTVEDAELSKYQLCYFDRFIPTFESCLEKLKTDFSRFSTLQKILVVVSCHGCNHNYIYKNNKLVKEGK